MLVLQETDQGEYDATLQTVKDLGLPFTELTGKDVNKLYRGVQYNDDHKAFIDHEAGILMANKCLASYQVVTPIVVKF